MERPQQHVTDSQGDAQLRSVFAPTGWTVTKIENDYGIDYDIEIFHNFKSTGAHFKGQLKSSNSTEYSADGSFISEAIEKKNVHYLCQEVRAPVILFHADVQSGRTYWSAPQLDIAALEAFARDAGAKNFTFRIPTASRLPETLERLLEAVRSAEMVLASRVLVAAETPEFVESLRGRVDEEEVIRQLRLKANALQVERVERLFKVGSLAEARDRIRQLLADSTALVEQKFWALLIAEKIELRALGNAGRGDERLRVQFAITGRLQQVTRHGPPHLKFYALIARKAAELDGLISTDYGLYINWKVNEAEGDPFWKTQLTFERAALVRRIVLKYNQCIRLVRYAADYIHQWVLPTALLRIAVASSVLILRLKLEGMEDARQRFTRSSLAICRLAANIAARYQDDEALADAAIAAFLLDPEDGSGAGKCTTEALEAISDPKIRQDAERRLKAHTDKLQTDEAEIAERRFSIEEARQVYKNMARALGIDLSDPTDRIAQVVRIGLKDLDPSRILRNCEHIFVTLSFRGLPAEWLQLPTAGGKVIHCLKHRHAVEGLDLDLTYQAFKSQFCDKCPDCSPRPPAWKYSPEWQEQENKRHEQFVRDFDRRTGREGRS